MEPNNTDGSEVLETTEEVAGETTETLEADTTTDETISPDEIAELRKKAAERDELEKKNKQLYERAKKAESSSKKEPEMLNDVLYLAKADIHADDVDEVLEKAKLLKMSVQEAHKFLKPILDTRAEERKTASATLTRAPQRGGTKVSGSDLLAKFERTGEAPESDEATTALFQARTLRRLGK